MPIAPVRAIPVPQESRLIARRGSTTGPSLYDYRDAFFVDAFAVTLPARQPGQKEYSAMALARTVFCDPPPWFTLLLWIRDHVMSVFGVKRSTEIQAEAVKKGVETIYMFPVISRTQCEVVFGEKDRHLDFQTSVLVREAPVSGVSGLDSEAEDSLRQGGRGQELVAMTVVHCHGLFGKVYISLIRVFHVLIVKYSLARVPSRIEAGYKVD